MTAVFAATVAATMAAGPPMTPMTVNMVINFIKRAYNAAKPFQWVREALVNALEAHATRVLFDVNLAYYEANGHLLMDICDNGDGIAFTDIGKFFNTFGGGGKPIGDEHDNFGVGLKISVLPWSEILVRTLRNGELSIFKLTYDDDTGAVGIEYLPVLGDALRPEDADPSDPIEYEEILHTRNLNGVLTEDGERVGWVWRGVDWILTLPQMIRDAGHGTVITLLGNDEYHDTFMGDPNASDEQSARWARLEYINRRFLMFEPGVTVQVGTSDASFKDRDKICATLDAEIAKIKGKTEAEIEATIEADVAPVDEEEFEGTNVKHWERRKARGLLRSIIMLPKKCWTINGLDPKTDPADPNWVRSATFDIGVDNLPAKVTIFFKDVPGMVPDDFADKPSRYGICAAVYKGETYDLDDSGVKHRMCGVYFDKLHAKTWILVTPQFQATHHESDAEVYPDNSRSRLFWRNSATKSQELPWDDWGVEIEQRLAVEAKFLYDAIQNEIGGASGGDEVDKSVLERATNQFAGRFNPYKVPRPKKPVTPDEADEDSIEVDELDEETGEIKPQSAMINDNGDEPMTDDGPQGKAAPKGGTKTPNGKGGGGKGGRSGPNRKGVEDPDGSERGRPSKAKTSVFAQDPEGSDVGLGHKPGKDENVTPTPVWVSFNEMYPKDVKDLGPNLSCWHVSTTQADGSTKHVLHCNTDNTVYLGTVAWWQDKYGNKPGINTEIELAVRDVLETSVSIGVGVLMRQKLSQTQMGQRLTPLSMANFFNDIYDHHDHIRDRIKERLGKGVKPVASTRRPRTPRRSKVTV